MKSAHKIDLATIWRSEDTVTQDTSKRTFADLLLPDKLLAGLSNSGYLHPSPIQWAALPLAIKVGQDLMIQSKSGTGKTLVYVLTALNIIHTDVNAVQVLILAPTREIAIQGARVALDIAGNLIPDMKIHTFIGGMSVSDDLIKLKKCHLAIGTPGRIRQLIESNAFSVKAVRFFALDEADKLMEPSFKNDITWIFNKLPIAKQVMALSATYPESLADLVLSYMRSPSHCRLSKDNQNLKGVSQFVLVTPFHPKPQQQDAIKFKALLSLLTGITFNQCIVFTNYVVKAQSLSDKLNNNGWPAIFISSSQDQESRLRAVTSLRLFQCRILITTDLTARGIDAQNVNLIINLEIPRDPETYLHRIGRSGRFGSSGVAVSIASEGQEFNQLRAIVHTTKSAVSVLPRSENGITDLSALCQATTEEDSSSTFQLVEPLRPSDSGEVDVSTEIYQKETKANVPKEEPACLQDQDLSSQGSDDSADPFYSNEVICFEDTIREDYLIDAFHSATGYRFQSTSERLRSQAAHRLKCFLLRAQSLHRAQEDQQSPCLTSVVEIASAVHQCLSNEADSIGIQTADGAVTTTKEEQEACRIYEEACVESWTQRVKPIKEELEQMGDDMSKAAEWIMNTEADQIVDPDEPAALPQSDDEEKYPEPYVAHWVPCETSETANVGHSPASAAVWQNAEYSAAPEADFQFPFPDPNAAMAKYLRPAPPSSSLAAIFPHWLNQVKRNQQIIQDQEFTYLMSLTGK